MLFNPLFTEFTAMKLHEFQAKELFKKHGITVPRSFLVRKLSELKQKKLKGEYAVKAQVLVGGRGKAGGVKFCHATMVPEAAAGMLGNYLKGERVESVLVEEKLDVRREYYLSLAISRSEKSVVFLFSRAGGVDIEELAREQPQEVHRLLLGSFEWARVFSFFLALEKEHANALTEVVEKMHRLMTSKDCELVEINPLVLDARGKFLAADAKVSIDENALYRHPEFESFKGAAHATKLEERARAKGLAYVELEGDIAVIGNGAGLVMATLDVLNYFGGKPANFLDVGGGAAHEKMEHALRIVLAKKPTPRVALVNIFGGITRCDEIAEGLARFKKKHKVTQPLVVRMIGTNEAEGKRVLEKNGIHAMNSMEDAARKAVQLAGSIGGVE